MAEGRQHRDRRRRSRSSSGGRKHKKRRSSSSRDRRRDDRGVRGPSPGDDRRRRISTSQREEQAAAATRSRGRSSSRGTSPRPSPRPSPHRYRYRYRWNKSKSSACNRDGARTNGNRPQRQQPQQQPQRQRRPTGFAVPSDAPMASSRLDAQFYLLLSSAVALSSLSAAVPPRLRSNAETSMLTLQAVSFALALSTGTGLRCEPARETLTQPLFRPHSPLSHVSAETVVNSLQLLLWMTGAGLPFTRSAREPAASVWNTNLYYSTLSGLAASSFLVADSYTSDTTQVFFPKGYNFKVHALRRNWMLLLMAQVLLVAFCLQGLAECTSATGDGGGGAPRCSELPLGVSLATIAALLAVGHFVLRIFQRVGIISTRTSTTSARKMLLHDTSTKNHANVHLHASSVETVMAAINFICSTVNAAILSDDDKEEYYASVSIYFTSWISFFVGLNLCLRYLDAHLSPGSMMDISDYNNWVVKMNNIRVIDESKAPSSSSSCTQLIKRRSTGSTKTNRSSQTAATANLESMVASNESSAPILYLDNKTTASPLSYDEEVGHFQSTRRRDDPSRYYIPNNGMEPQGSISTPSQQKSIRALPMPMMPPPMLMSRRPSIDPQGSISTRSQQTSVVRAPPPTRVGREPTRSAQRPQESISSSSSLQQSVRALPIKPPPATMGGEPKTLIPQYGVDPQEASSSSSSEYLNTSRKRMDVPRSVAKQSASTASNYSRKNSFGSNYDKSMTAFVTAVPPSGLASQRSPFRQQPETAASRKDGQPSKSMLSLFDEVSAEKVIAAIAQVDHNTSQESSPTTLDPPPTLDPSHSSRMRTPSPSLKANPSIRSGRTSKSRASNMSISKGSKSLSRAHSYPSTARSGPSPSPGNKSRTSSRARSSATGGSKGPPTLSEDDTLSPIGTGRSGPLTLSDDDLVYDADAMSQSVEGRPVRDIAMDNFSIVSDPTMDGFDQSQAGSSFRRKQSSATVVNEDNVSQSGTVDQMVMLALKQAYELRQQSIRQMSGGSKPNERSISSTGGSRLDIPRRASSGGAGPKPTQPSFGEHNDSENVLTKTMGRRSNSGVTGGSGKSSGRSIRSFYSNYDFDGSNAESEGDHSSAFAC